MHSDVSAEPRKVLKVRYGLATGGHRFALLRHMMSSPLHVVIMAAVMLVVMTVLMMAMMR